jgi:hypothetical protein
MAKELPYFKFEPNAWENGNVQICSREDKGLFMDVCSMYWSRLGVLPFKLAIQKLCGGNAVAFDSLISEGIIEVIDDLVYIEFLNEQLQEFEDLSETNRKNALEGWRKRKESKKKSGGNAVASKSQCESDAIREEKRKEDKIREEKSLQENIVFPFDSIEFKKQWEIWKDFKKKEFKFNFKTSQSEQAALTQLNNLANGIEQTSIEIIHQSLANGWKGFFELKQNNNGQSKQSFSEKANEYLKHNDPDYQNY